MKSTIYLVAEEVDEFPDEAYAKVVFELRRALLSRAALLTHLTPVVSGAGPNHSAPRLAGRGMRRMLAVADRGLWREIRRSRPDTLVYVSRSSATLAALARSRMLRLMSRGTRVVMIALQPRVLSGPARLLSRLLWPDLLLLSTEAEVRQARALGATADRMITGVDLERFRPALPGEKADLRRRWGLPLDSKIVLHVGHLTNGRNLEALLPLAGEPGVTVVMVASSQQDAESPRLEQLLRSRGVIVLRGFMPNIDEVYRLADCYAFPTTSSDHAIALPLSVLEALATDLPVAAMRFGALEERFGSAPGFVLVESAEQLKRAALELVGGGSATRHLAEAFSWGAVADHLVGPPG